MLAAVLPALTALPTELVLLTLTVLTPLSLPSLLLLRSLLALPSSLAPLSILLSSPLLGRLSLPLPLPALLGLLILAFRGHFAGQRVALFPLLVTLVALLAM